VLVAYSALTLLVGRQEVHLASKNGGWWRWALVSPDGVARSWMVGVEKSRCSVLAPAHPGGPRKRAVNGRGVVALLIAYGSKTVKY